MVILAVSLAGGSASRSQAQGSLTVAFDMNPTNGGPPAWSAATGNQCPGTGNAGGKDCFLGPIDDCVQVSAGDTISFDVVLKDIPEGETFGGPEYFVGWPAELLLTINQPVPSGAGETTVGVNLIADDPGSGGPYVSGSSGVPNSVSPHHATVGDLGVAEKNPPFTKGVVHRFNATVGALTPAGTYRMFFDQSEPGGPVIIGNEHGVNMCVLYGCTLLDGNSGYGLIAVAPAVCGRVGGIAELPHVSGSSGSNYLALAALAAVGLLALTAVARYARRRWLR